jgi:hypothetical protein
MLYIFYGTDEKTARDKARVLLGALQKKAPDAELVRVTDEDVQDNNGMLHIEHYLETSGLFKANYLLYLDGVDDVFLSFSDTQLDLMKQSLHICVVLLGAIKQKDLNRIKTFADKVVFCESDKPKQKDKVDIFVAANALKSRSKPSLWQELVYIRFRGDAAEAVVGILFWAVKDMLLKRQYQKYSKKELIKMSTTLANLPHKAREDGVTIHNALEYFALTSI